MPVNGEQALFLDEIFGSSALPSPFQGVLRVTSSLPIAIAMLRTRVNERGDFLITTTPPVPDSAPTAADLVFPHFAEGGGYSMQFIVFGRTSSGTIDFSTPLLFR
jgi:hypothetical protein